MALFFYNRPLEKADPTERLVAEYLAKLSDDWLIRWGYFYAGAREDHEGDFLVLGPDGRILVLEVKSGHCRHFGLHGEWEGGTDNPSTQLLGEWNAVIERLNEVGDGQRPPFVGKALCLPHVNKLDQERLLGEHCPVDYLFREGLEKFEDWWREHMGRHATHCKDSRGFFHKALAPGMQPAKVRDFLRQSDRMFDRFMQGESEILVMLKRNRQLLIEGGFGSGKTFLAVRHAQMLAESGKNGKRVLFLSYNLMLADRLRRLTGRLKLERGSVEVRSWEELMSEILAVEGLVLEPPDSQEGRRHYYRRELPEFVRMALESGKVVPTYDALVVDEAQDHDTNTGDFLKEPAGWWNWYFRLLREGAHAPIGIYYDLTQRPAFRGPEPDWLERLWLVLYQPVHVRLQRSLRFTRPILKFLKTMYKMRDLELPESLEQPHPDLPTGPEVTLREMVQSGSVVQNVESILQDWQQKGLCKPSDVILIGFSRLLEKSSLAGVGTLLGFPLIDYNEESLGSISYIGAHRAKGLDFRAVIVVDFSYQKSFKSGPQQEAFFIAMTRARQLLGVITTNSPEGFVIEDPFIILGHP